jgi:formylglycine-generating enzyme required for sulfatase activity
MAADFFIQPISPLRRRLARRAGIMAALIVVGWAAWYFGVKLPDKREAAAAAKLRAANARTIPDLNLDLVWIAPGSFLMGTPEQSMLVKWIYATRENLTKKAIPGNGFNNERPATWVTLTQPFWLGRTDVTQGQYEAVMGINPSHFKAAGLNAPIEHVSWEDAMAFCWKLTERERPAGRLPDGYAYTLPTEAQWEYACRAGTTGKFAGDLDAMAWYDENSGATTHPVGEKRPNAWGLSDMQGNVFEFCQWLGGYPGGEVTNPRGPAPDFSHVLRGGSWFVGALDCRPAFRYEYIPDEPLSFVGFRLALAPLAMR